MAACIVCNQKIVAYDLQDGSDMGSLCSRLEKVLGETVPVDCVVCASCQFDLAQIEMYYALLAVFKKRYSDTAKQRLQAQNGEPSRSVFHETAGCSSENLQSMFGTADLSDTSTHGPFSPPLLTKDGALSNQTADSSLDILDVGAVKQEFQVNTPLLQENPKTIAFPIWRPVVGPKKRGRPSNNEESTDVSSPSVVAVPKKRGRPRKGEASNLRGLKKRGRPKKSKALSSVVSGGSALPGKKRGRPRKSESTDNSKSEADMMNDDSETSMGDESEMAGLDPVHDRALDPTSDENNLEGGSDEQQRQDKDGDYVPATGPAARRKQRRPKKVEQGPEVPVSCPICNKVILGTYRMSTHMNSHTESRPHLCPECGKGFKNKNALRGHIKTHNEDRPFGCSQCGKVFKRRKDLDRHAFIHTNERPVPCDQCDEMFKCQNDLKSHIKYKHLQGRKFLCNICGVAMYTEGNLRRHIISHTEVKLFKCHTCGKGFTSKQTLLNHEFTHQGEDTREKHLCPTCGKEFAQKYYLKCHIKIHTGESKHYCSTCNKYFLKAALYRNHMRTHSGERPYRCFECGKSFRQRGVLRVHMMAHNDVRPFKCACGQAFRQKAKLQRHMRTKVHAAFEKNAAPAQLASAPFVPPLVTPATVAAPYMVPDPLPLHPLVMALTDTQGPAVYTNLN